MRAGRQSNRGEGLSGLAETVSSVVVDRHRQMFKLLSSSSSSFCCSASNANIVLRAFRWRLRRELPCACCKWPMGTLGTPVVGLAIGWAMTAALRQAASASEGNHYRDSRRLLRKTERKIKCD
jgi:hypothetical protein